MAERIFTYHQVMPEFIKNILMFGFREYAQAGVVTTLQTQNRITHLGHSLKIPELGRSGRSTELCYGLRSVERFPVQTHWPWSVRLCSLYSFFDVRSGQSTYIVLKADKVIEKLIRDSLETKHIPSSNELSFIQSGFIATLQVHELVAGWTQENWWGYIDFLESRLQEYTRPALSMSTDYEPDVIQHQFTFRDVQQRITSESKPMKPSTSWAITSTF